MTDGHKNHTVRFSAALPVGVWGPGSYLLAALLWPVVDPSLLAQDGQQLGRVQLP